MNRVSPRLVALACLLALPAASFPQGPAIVITGYMAAPAGTDSPFEYVQLRTTRTINFGTENFSVVVANNNPATANGWIEGGSRTYKFNLTSGTVTAGSTFYVGGSARLINGALSTDISGETWARFIDTGTTGGDGFGSANANGVMGNGSGTMGSADGIAVFAGTSPTSSSVPIDGLFYGQVVGAAFLTTTTGYQLPVNDRYSGGKLQTTSFLFPDTPGSTGDYTRISAGALNASTGTWTAARTGTVVSAPTTLGDITPTFTVNYNQTWNVAGGGAWDTAATNWVEQSAMAGVRSTFLGGDNVTFNNTAGGTITVAGGGVAPRDVSVSAASGTYTFTGGAVTASGTLTKSGAGRLNVNNAVTAAAVAVTGGTLGGTGTLVGNVTVSGNAHVAPGASPGKLSVTGSVDFAASSHLDVEIGGANDSDSHRSQLALTGALTFGAFSINVTNFGAFAGTPGVTSNYTIIAAGSIGSAGLDTAFSVFLGPGGSGNGTNGTVTLNVSGFAAGDQFSLSRSGPNILLTYTPVPEPAAVLGVFCLGLVGRAIRRRSIAIG